jgi:ketosteroid isomerase-like protein
MFSSRPIKAIVSIAVGLLMLSSTAVAAQDASCPATTPEENVALVQRLYEAVNTVDAKTIDDLLADNYTHNVNRYGLPDDPTSNQDEIQLATMMSQFYPGSTDVVREVFGSGDKVVVETTRTITGHTFSGKLATLEQPFEFRTIAILTIQCGQVVSMDALGNNLELMIALGVIQLPDIAPKG